MARTPSSPEVIATDSQNLVTYEFRVGRNENPDLPRYQIQFRPANSTSSRWESASMGNYRNRAEAIKNFLPRYAGDKSGLTIFDPELEKLRDKALREHRMVEEGRQRDLLRAQEAMKKDAERRERLRQIVKAATFRNEETKRAGREGDLPSVKGPSFAGLTVHKSTPSPGRKTEWTITHQASGYTLGDEFATQGDAKVAVVRLAQALDWSQDINALQKSGIQAGAAVRRMQGNPFADLSDLKGWDKELKDTENGLDASSGLEKGKGAKKTALDGAQKGDRMPKKILTPRQQEVADRFESLGFSYYLRPRKKTISISGFPAISIPAAIKRMEQAIVSREADLATRRQKGLLRQKESPGISATAALSRFTSPTSATGRSRRRDPARDARVRAKTVAPAEAKTEKDIRLQRLWFKHPNQLDFEGVDTPASRKKAKNTIKSRRL